ncbi:hypothetical protein WS73_22210 [Burkholderia savannae]|nr:hypothetical protein WS73_22210 [Burkholderia savannae]
MRALRFPTTGKLQPWALLPDGGEPPNLRAAMTCNDMEALRAAVTAGFGIGYRPGFLARDARAAGAPTPPPDAPLPPAPPAATHRCRP